MTLLPLLVLAAQVPVSWFWSDEQATRQYSMDQVKKPYSASLQVVDRDQMVEIATKGKKVLSIPTHEFSVFTIKDGKLYLAEFHFMASGCQVESFDLKTGKSVWKTPLKGLGPIAHSKYRNRVLIRFEGKTLVIYGNESSGQYREVLEPKSGKMLDNATFPH
jgi:hypothetical protein